MDLTLNRSVLALLENAYIKDKLDLIEQNLNRKFDGVVGAINNLVDCLKGERMNNN